MKVVNAGNFGSALVVTGLGPNLIFGLDLAVPDRFADPNNIYVGQTAPPLGLWVNNSDLGLTSTSHTYGLKISNATTGAVVLDTETQVLFALDANGNVELSYPWTSGAMTTPGTYYMTWRAKDNQDNRIFKFPRQRMTVRAPV